MTKRKFKVGDKVRINVNIGSVIKDCDVGIITMVTDDIKDLMPYKVFFNRTNEFHWCSEDYLELVESYKTYEQGLEEGRNEAWEMARKLTTDKHTGGFGLEELYNIFGTTNNYKVIKYNTFQELKEKIEAYEASNSLKVGDEVVSKRTGGKAVITRNDKEGCYVLWHDGSCGRYHMNDFTKTGRVINEFAEILDEDVRRS